MKISENINKTFQENCIFQPKQYPLSIFTIKNRFNNQHKTVTRLRHTNHRPQLLCNNRCTKGALRKNGNFRKLSPSGRETGGGGDAGRGWAEAREQHRTTTIPNKTANNNIKRIDRRRSVRPKVPPIPPPVHFFPLFRLIASIFSRLFCNFFSTQIRDGAVPAHFCRRLFLSRSCVVDARARRIYDIRVRFVLKNRKTSCVPFCRCNFRES